MRWFRTKSHELHTAWNGDGPEPEPCRTKKKNKLLSEPLRIFGLRINWWTWETALVTAVVATGEIWHPKRIPAEPWRVETRMRGDGRICGEKVKWQSSRIDKRFINIGQRPEMPERKRTMTPTMLQTLEEWCVLHGVQDWKRGRGGCASGLFSGLANWGGRPQIMVYKKKEATRTQVKGCGMERKLTMSSGDESWTGYGLEKN